MSRNLRILGAFGILAGCIATLSACSTATPVLIQSAKLPALQGRVNTTAGYTGTITTDNQACRGSFTGILGQVVATVEVSCSDGRKGLGTAAIQDGRFVSADVWLSDGTRLTIRPTGPGFP